MTDSGAAAGTNGSMTTSFSNLRNGLRVAAFLVACTLSGGPALAGERNACGCYQTDAGACVCEKAARCGCPGLCEPKGCEAKRDKALQREIDSETRKARDADKQRVDSTSEGGAPNPAPPAPPRAAHEMNPVQTRELARLLDLYVATHPKARRQSVGTLRDELTPAR